MAIPSEIILLLPKGSRTALKFRVVGKLEVEIGAIETEQNEKRRATCRMGCESVGLLNE